MLLRDTRKMRTLLVSLLLSMLIQTADAQVLYGSVVGTVTDPSGAPVLLATATLSNLQTGQDLRADTDSAGFFNFPTVPPGRYTLTLNHAGFSRFVRENLAVVINSVIRTDVQMQIGSVTEQIVVSSAAPLLQTERADVHTDFETSQLENLPVPPSRNFQQLLGTVPGFTPPGQTNSVGANPARALSFNVNGTSRYGNNIRIDGATMNQVYLPYLVMYVPAIEAIDNVNVVTNSFTAEQGLAGGAAINAIIKSGTNSFHGSAFEFHNDNALKAKPFFLPAGQGKPKYIFNQFGGTLGGPIVRNKLFFFGSYEGTFDRETGANLLTVATTDIRAGNMSASPTPIYDPLTGNPDGSGRTAFPGNVIPMDRQSSAALKLISLLPAPNLPGLINNYYATGAYKFDRNTIDAKVNYIATDKFTMYARFGLMKYSMENPPAFGPLGGTFVQTTSGFAGTSVGKTWSGSVGGTYIVKPSLIIDGTFGLSILDTDAEQIRLNEDLGSSYLGIPGTNNHGQKIAGGWPSFSIANYATLGLPFTNWPIIYFDPQFRYALNVNWNKGQHNFRFGTETAQQHMNHAEYTMTGASGGGAGLFSFPGGVTTLRGGASPNQFNSFSDFLLGLPSTMQKMQQPDTIPTRAWAQGLVRSGPVAAKSKADSDLWCALGVLSYADPWRPRSGAL